MGLQEAFFDFFFIDYNQIYLSLKKLFFLLSKPFEKFLSYKCNVSKTCVYFSWSEINIYFSKSVFNISLSFHWNPMRKKTKSAKIDFPKWSFSKSYYSYFFNGKKNVHVLRYFSFFIFLFSMLMRNFEICRKKGRS